MSVDVFVCQQLVFHLVPIMRTLTFQMIKMSLSNHKHNITAYYSCKLEIAVQVV